MRTHPQSDVESVDAMFRSVAGRDWREKVIRFPTDVFGIAANLLSRTGAYLAVVCNWPPTDSIYGDWSSGIQTIGKEWREKWKFGGSKPPEGVQIMWDSIIRDADVKVSELFELDYSKVLAKRPTKPARLCRHLLEILATADEACSGIGIPGNTGKFATAIEEWGAFRLYTQFIFKSPATLCSHINAIHFSVLPKLHTPQSGITIRSLSHNLSLCHGSEVKVRWGWGSSPQAGDVRHGLNILLLPWPDTIRPSDFASCSPRWGQLPNMQQSKHGFFAYRIRGGRRWDLPRFRDVLKRAAALTGTIDAIVMPELAVTKVEFDRIASGLIKIRPRPPMLIAGVAAPCDGDRIRNVSITLVPLPSKNRKGAFEYVPFEQSKHHRWKLDERQIFQYGLGGMLDPSCFWWENSHVPRRELIFVSINPWLTMCTLLCEDLARPDPIADIVRTVGPNLIIALLMDGPQLAKRWPARYGTVLADDPGSSVLTVTNLAMAELSRARGHPASRVVALWKDAQCGEPIEVSLPPNKEAILLCLTREYSVEFAADGRSDGGISARLNLSGIHPL